MEIGKTTEEKLENIEKLSFYFKEILEGIRLQRENNKKENHGKESDSEIHIKIGEFTLKDFEIKIKVPPINIKL